MRCARTGRLIEDGAEAVEAVEDNPTRAEAGLTGEVGVVAVEAEGGAWPPRQRMITTTTVANENTMYIFFSHQKLL
jgi:hypothetical protein